MGGSKEPQNKNIKIAPLSYQKKGENNYGPNCNFVP